MHKLRLKQDSPLTALSVGLDGEHDTSNDPVIRKDGITEVDEPHYQALMSSEDAILIEEVEC